MGVMLIGIAFVSIQCSSENPELGEAQYSIIECNGGSVGQACDTDDDPCTQEVCVQAGQNVSCQLQQLAPDGTACLSDGEPCTLDTCQSGLCEHEPLQSGTLCDDGLFCTTGDFCNDVGICGGGSLNCDDGNSCTADACDEMTQSCDNQVVVDAPCDDGDACSQTSRCDLAGACIGDLPVDCDDGSECTTDTCDPILGCQSQIDENAPCSDDFFCTIGETCTIGGDCQGFANCDDGNACTMDSCDELAENCSNEVTPGIGCSDFNACTTADTCDALGSCVGMPVDNGSPCGQQGGCFTGGTCQNGLCEDTLMQPDGTSCNDSDACTTSDSCGAGTCLGSPISCDDGDPCTADGCDPVSGCFHSAIAGCAGDAGVPLSDAGNFEDDAGGALSDAGLPGSGDGGQSQEGVLGGGGCNTSSGNSSWVFVVLVLLAASARKRWGKWLALTSFLLLPQLGHADGFDSELFKPNSSSTTFFSQDAAEVLPSSTWNVGVGFHVSTSPLVLRDAETGAALPNGVVVSSRTGAYLAGNYGFLQRFEVGVVLPFVLRQNGSGEMLVGNPQLNATSLADMRLDLKGRIWSMGRMQLVAAVSTTLPTGDDETLLGETSMTVTPKVILGISRGGFRFGLNAGVKIRPQNEVSSLVLDDEFRFGLGADYELLSKRLWVMAESYGNRSLQSSDAEAFPVEAIVGARYAVTGPWQLQAGAGTGLSRGYGTPSFRGLMTLAYRPSEEAVAMLPPVAKEVVEKKTQVEDEGVVDADGDGILDADDLCAFEAEDMDGFEDEDGCPELDNDKDKILDVDDACPLKAEVLNGVDDTDGCPDAGIIVMKLDRVTIEEKVLFDRNRARVKHQGKKALRAIVMMYLQHPEWGQMKIHGHTDSQGPTDYNLELSQRRASRVRDVMISMGMDSTKISSEGFGEEKPLASNSDERGRMRNRRVEFIIETPVDP